MKIQNLRAELSNNEHCRQWLLEMISSLCLQCYRSTPFPSGMKALPDVVNPLSHLQTRSRVLTVHHKHHGRLRCSMFYAFRGNCFNTLAPTEKQSKNKAEACFALEVRVTFI